MSDRIPDMQSSFIASAHFRQVRLVGLESPFARWNSNMPVPTKSLAGKAAGDSVDGGTLPERFR